MDFSEASRRNEYAYGNSWADSKRELEYKENQSKDGG
jgi:hypothetical protein